MGDFGCENSVCVIQMDPIAGFVVKMYPCVWEGYLSEYCIFKTS